MYSKAWHGNRTAYISKLLQLPITTVSNHVSQSESRIQILLQFDWMAQFSLLQPDVAKNALD